MHTRIVLALVVVCSASVALVASAADTQPVLSPIDPTISFVETRGSWESSRLRGRYRAVVQTRCSTEHCRDRLFIQWLVDNPSERVAATTYVAEVGDLTHISRVRFMLGSTGTKIEINHEADGDDLKWTRCLVLGAEGRYIHREGACPRGN
jgi:hypothetical protein